MGETLILGDVDSPNRALQVVALRDGESLELPAGPVEHTVFVTDGRGIATSTAGDTRPRRGSSLLALVRASSAMLSADTDPLEPVTRNG
jgi:hypothetical protein